MASELNLEGGKYVEELGMHKKELALLGEGTAHKTTPRASVPCGATEDAVEVR